MAHGVFIVRTDSIYDDNPAEQYQFPPQYLSRAEKFVGDWIVYYEPRGVRATRGYFAIARVQQIIRDPKASDRYLALIAPQSYLEFASPVAFNGQEGPVERGLLNERGKISGRAQSAVRPILAVDFAQIVDRGLSEDAALLPRSDDPAAESGVADEAAGYQADDFTERLRRLTSRVVRDRAFRGTVLNAYDKRCAVTGLKFINGGGRAEVAAAHIQPVEMNGPDSIANGIALSGTAHWMFDRGLIGLADNLDILISRTVNDVAGVKAFINSSGRAVPPVRSRDRPHPRFLAWHRTFWREHWPHAVDS